MKVQGTLSQQHEDLLGRIIKLSTIMNLFNDNVLPGRRGKVFVTNAKDEKDIDLIMKEVKKLSGVQSVLLNTEKSPVEITVLVDVFTILKLVKVEEAVKSVGFHLIPKEVF